MNRILFTLIIFLILGCGRSFERIDTLPKFSTTDLSGNIVTEEIFSEQKISTLTIFTTDSAPSMNLVKKLDSKNICLLANFNGEFKIRTRARVLIANEDFAELLKTIRVVPITFFIDSRGNFIGQEVIGDDIDLIQRELNRLSK